jgi:HSP20 family protein
MKPEELDVSLSDSTLTVRGERGQEKQQKREEYHVRERTHGSFTRSVRLPAPVDSEKVTSQFKDGVLTIALPKSEQARPKKITITT